MNLIGRKFENSRLNMEIFVYEIDGKEWFIGNDVAILLGYSNYQKALQQHVWKENKKSIYVKTLENIGNTPFKDTLIVVNNNKLFINEVGLYQLIFKSKLPKAEEFQKWVFEDVLPSIRKNNAYIDKENITSEQFENLQKELLDLTQQRDNFNNILINNKRKKQRLKTFLENMFPQIKDVYNQFLSNMQEKGSLDSNFIPTDKFIQQNKERNMFIHITKTNEDVKHYLVLTNEGMAELSRRLYIEDDKLKIKTIYKE